MGRLADRFGVVVPVVIGAVALAPATRAGRDVACGSSPSRRAC